MDIERLIADASNRADRLLGNAQAELAGAGAQLSNIYGGAGIATLDEKSVIRLPELDSVTLATPPQIERLSIDTSGAPGAAPSIEYTGDPMSDLGEIPTFDASVPTLSFPTAPTVASAFILSAPDVDLNIDFPDAPDLLSTTIDPPNIVERAIPEAPDVQIPSFSEVAPSDALPSVGDMKSVFLTTRSQFSTEMVTACERRIDDMLAKVNPRYHEQMSRIEQQLEKYLAGGTGLNPAVENAIYERSKDKVNAEYQRERDVVFGDMAKRGFTMPTGAGFSAAMQARQKGADNNARASTEIAIKAAEIEQQNLQFAVTTSSTLRTTILQAMMSYHQNLISVDAQALDGAKGVLQAMIETADTAIKIYSARLDAYKTQANVFVSRIQASAAIIDVYKAKISAFESLANVDMAKVNVYRARIEAMSSVAQIYRTQVQAIVDKAQLERLKVDVFGAQVQAYSAQLQGKNAEIQGYSAAIAGEEAKVRAYTAQAQAFSARVSGFSAQVQAKSVQVQATATRNRGVLDSYVAMNQAYSARMQAEAAKVGAESDVQRNLITEYAQANSAVIAKASADAERFRMVSQVALEEGRMNISKVQETARIKLATAQGIAQTAVSAAGIYSGLSSAAMAGMNTLVTQTGEG
jgi:hypothetical protein